MEKKLWRNMSGAERKNYQYKKIWDTYYKLKEKETNKK